MGTTDYGREQVGSWVSGDAPSSPDYCEFGIGSTGFYAGSPNLVDGIIRKTISWNWVDDDPQGTATLNTTEANGSSIGEFGFGVGASVAGSNITFRGLSAVGTKDSSFDVEINAKIRVRSTVD